MSATDSHKEYYEIPEFWNYNFLDDETERMRVSAVILSIPEDVQSILEVGCGNGAIVNNIAKQRKMEKIVGVDISTSALAHVKTEKVEGNINDLKFKNKSFDLIIASEVIEHLTHNDFLRGIEEIQRISDQYILISVPNNEQLQVNTRMCHNCYCWFNPDYHMKVFDKQKLSSLFDKFEVVWVKAIGPVLKSIQYSKIAAIWFHYLKRNIPRIGICPQCGFNHSEYQKKESGSVHYKKQDNFFKKKMNVMFEIFLKLFFTRKVNKSRWLLVLYKRSRY